MEGGWSGNERERGRETETGHLREKWAPAEKKTEKRRDGGGKELTRKGI